MFTLHPRDSFIMRNVSNYYFQGKHFCNNIPYLGENGGEKMPIFILNPYKKDDHFHM